MSGSAQPAFARVQARFAELFSAGIERGAGVAVVVDGRVVVDMWGGISSSSRSQPWTRTTVANVWSTTKGITALLAVRLIAEQRLDPDAPVSEYWPEFAVAGKSRIPVRWLLTHRCGLPGFSAPTSIASLYDWDTTVGALAAMEPVWEPGRVTGYHAVTFGYLVGEVIRRVDGRSVGRIVQEDLAEPFGLELTLGPGTEAAGQIAEIDRAPAPPGNDFERLAASHDPLLTAMNANLALDPYVANSKEWRTAEIPSANLHASARSLAQVYGLAVSGLDHQRLLRHSAVEDLIVSGSETDFDVVHQRDRRYAMGFLMSGRAGLYGPTEHAFGHHGWGGSVAFADPRHSLAFAYVTAHMGWQLDNDRRYDSLVKATYESIGQER